jgi:hypothetical protein
MPNRRFPPLPPVLEHAAEMRALQLRGDWANFIGKAEVEKGKTGEELFNLICSGVREIFDISPVIAGGAVRDLAAGYDDHKDVDVFVPVDPKVFLARGEELGWAVGPYILDAPPKGTDYDKQEPSFVKSLGRAGAVVQGFPVDVVLLSEPLTPVMVDLFPVHAQRCVWTLEQGLKMSPEARKDIENETFTIDQSITDKERLKNILKKVEGWKKRKFYKDWKIVEPDIKEWWEMKKEDALEKKNKKAVIKNGDTFTQTFKVFLGD